MKKYFIILCILLLTGCSNKIDYVEKLSIKIGDEIPKSSDYVKNIPDLGTIEWKDLESDDNKVYHSGTYTGIITIKKETLNLILEVIDDEKPTIEGVKDITITEGTEVDLLKDVVIKDNSKDEVKSEVLGEYDINKPGTYKLSVNATDKDNNTNSVEFNLIVNEKPKEEVKPVTPTPTPTPAPQKEDVDLSGVSTKGYEIKRVNGIYYVKGILVANKTYSLPSDYNPGGLLKEFNTAFNKMKADAAKEGISLWVASGFRSYSLQNGLYNQYSNSYGKASADTFSARPGHSEHQTGLAADLNQIDQSFGNTKAGKWLANNCYKYGFILRYPQGKQSITGYIYEPWHFRYIGDEAENLYNNGEWITLAEYLGIDSKYSN